MGSHQRFRGLAASLLVIVTAATVVPGRTRAQRGPGAQRSPLEHSTQAVLVVTAGWNSVVGTLLRYERRDAGERWRVIGSLTAIVVGRNGLAWGRGLAQAADDGPVKKEGDGKAPAGAFALREVFGQAATPFARLAMPYLFLADNVECVDDVKSAHYNTLVTSQRAGRADWTSSEKMWSEPLYKWGVLVVHNDAAVSAAPAGPRPEPGGGSCIFLHTWKGATSGTAGCTAMSEQALMELIRWLDLRRAPVLVQLPRAQYERLREPWALP